MKRRPIIGKEKIAKRSLRPICRYCRKPLGAYIKYNNSTEKTEMGTLATFTREFSGHYGNHGDDLFCSNICAERWGRTIARDIFIKGTAKLVLRGGAS